MRQDLPALQEAKQQARELRAESKALGEHIGHAQSLEKVAKQYGYRDWNAMHARIRDLPPARWRVGARITGAYLSQRFSATVRSIESRTPGWFAVELDLDDPVDVVRFEGFSNLRKRVRGVVGPQGHSRERTSDGEPHLSLD